MPWFAGDGSVYSWGRGMFGRIGSGSEKDELFPVQLKFGNANPNGTQDTVKIVGIAAGAYHSLALAGSHLSVLSNTSHLSISPFLYRYPTKLICISLDAISHVLP